MKDIITSHETDQHSKIPTTKSKGKKIRKKITLFKQGHKLPPNTLKCHKHVVNRNTSSQPLMTLAARQVINRILIKPQR